MWKQRRDIKLLYVLMQDVNAYTYHGAWLIYCHLQWIQDNTSLKMIGLCES